MLVLCHSLDDGIHTVIFPVQRVNVPLNRIIFTILGNIHHCIIIVSIGRSEQKHLISCQFQNLIMYLHQFFPFFGIGKLTHVFVVFTVVSKVMACRQNRLHIIRITLYPAPCHKKGYMYIMLLQYLQNLLRVLIPPCCVKGQCNFRFLRLHTVNRQFSAVHAVADTDIRSCCQNEPA